MQNHISPAMKPDDWYNDWAALIAQGRLPALLRPIWWLWRLYNSFRPTSILGRFCMMGLALFMFDVALNSGLGTPTLLAELAMTAVVFGLACGRREVTIIKPARVKPVRLHVVPEPDADASGHRRGRWIMRAVAVVLAVLLSVAAEHASAQARVQTITVVNQAPVPAKVRRVPLDRAMRLDQQYEAATEGIPLRAMRISCWHGPRGNAGCAFAFCASMGSATASSATASASWDFGNVYLYGTDGVVWSHGRLRVVTDEWLSFGDRCSHGH